MPSFTKAKTFAKCPLMSFWELLLLFLLFLSTIFVHVFFFFNLLCNGCCGLQTALHLPSWILTLVLQKKEILKKKKHRSLNRIEDMYPPLSYPQILSETFLLYFMVNNRVLRLPAIVLLNTTFRPGNSGLLRVYVLVSGSKRRVQ